MSMKLMMAGTATMFMAVASMVGNRVSGSALSDGVAKLRCGDAYLIPDEGQAIGDSTCGFNADMQFVAAMMALFAIGVVINIYGRIKYAKIRDRSS